MPSLQVLKGPNEGMLLPLEGDRIVLGRNPECGVVIPITSVSREHAQIVRIGGKYFIEDLKSRNKTFLNNQDVLTRTQLKNNDRIRICDFIAAFLDQATIPQDEVEEEDGGEDGPSTVEAMLNHTSNLLLETAPADKLRMLLEISGNLSKTLELNTLLPKIADSLFQVFKQADRCFLIVAEGENEETQKLQPRLVRTRRNADEGNARFSKSIVRECLKKNSAFLSDDASRDDRIQLSQSVVDFRIRSVMCAPLCRADGKSFGVIQLDTQDRGKKFTQEDLKLLCGVANQASISLENARLLDDAVKQEGMRKDLDLAHKVQGSFLPSSLPKVAGYDFFGHYEAAKAVGGDYYGYIPMPGGRICVAIGDVAGKGVAASLLMAKLSSDIRFAMLSEPDPATAVSKLNDLLYEFTSKLDRFVTLVAVVVDPATHEAILVSAGHDSPLLYRPATGELIDAMPKDVSGVPLGIMDGFPFDSHKITLQPNERLLLCTDGVFESRSATDVEFKHEGINRVLGGVKGLGTKELVERLVHAVNMHAAGRPTGPHDDLTVVALGRIG